jgi:hypothetical protein
MGSDLFFGEAPQRVVLVLCVLGSCILTCVWTQAGGRAAQAHPRLEGDWSEPLDGLKVRVVADRAVYHPGEWIQLTAYARNAGSEKLWVSAEVTLHVLTGSGDHRVHSPLSLNGATLSTGSAILHGRYYVRLTKAVAGWRPTGQEAVKRRPLDLSRPGTYTFWHEYEARAGAPDTTVKRSAPGERAWSGRIQSPRLKVVVRNLRESEVVRQPTARQFQDLRIIDEGPEKHGPKAFAQAQERLANDLLLAKNVDLADAAVALMAEHGAKGPSELSRPVQAPWYALSKRAVAVRLAIRGDYVRPLAELEMKMLEAWYKLTPDEDEKERRRAGARPTISVLLALCLDSKDEPLRKPLTALATANAKLPRLLPWRRGQDGEDLTLIRYYHWRLGMAWGVLDALDVLKGMTEAEVIAILGPPTSRQDNVLEWDAASRMHVNPFICVSVVDGRARSVRCGVR